MAHPDETKLPSRAPLNSNLNVACARSDKAAWVKQAQRENLKLEPWVNKVLNCYTQKKTGGNGHG